MELQELLKLQNGSDVRGIALEGVEGEHINLTPEIANIIARAFALFLSKRLGKPAEALKIAIGHDSRLSATELKNGALQGLKASGAVAFDCGLSSTPAMFMSILLPQTKMDGAIMLTASHLPFNRNGLKFFTAEGGLEKADIKELLTTAATLEPIATDVEAEKLPLIDFYAEDLCEKISQALDKKPADQPLKGLHIVVDAGNGAGGFFAHKVLAPLGADISGSIYLEPDGRFPNHIPNPENPEAMNAIQGAVLQAKADLGIIFDTDVDRMSAVLPNGQEINRNALIAMMAAILAPEYPGSTIITDSVTSDELTVFLESSLGLKHHRYMRGYKNVINECKRLNEAGVVSPLAIETSGHGALSENHYLDDGAYLAVKLLIAAAKASREGKDLASLIQDLAYPAEEKEYRLSIVDKADFHGFGMEVLKEFQRRAEEKGIQIASPSFEGVRLVFPGLGWILLRMSLHDPKMPMNMESVMEGGCKKLATIAYELTSGFEGLDNTMLAKASQ